MVNVLQSVWLVGSLVETAALRGWDLALNVTPEAMMLALWGGLLLALGHGVRQRKLQEPQRGPQVQRPDSVGRFVFRSASIPRTASSAE